MILFRFAVPAALSLAMAGCMGESMHSVELRRDSDGAKAFCMSNVYAVSLLPSLSEWKEKRYVAGCVASCIKEGFVIDARFPDIASTEDSPVDPMSEEKCIIAGKR